MRQVEMAKDASNAMMEMQLIDVTKASRKREMAKDADRVMLELSLIDERRANDQLSASLRVASPVYYPGMPFSHHFAHSLAHGRAAAIAAFEDARWAIKYRRGQVKD